MTMTTGALQGESTGRSPAGAATVDVSAVLDSARFGATQLLVSSVTFFALIMDGFDIQAMAFAGPVLIESWDMSRAALGPVLAASLVGMAAGAAGVGSLGDRYGRKRALIISCVLMGIGSIASAFATAPFELAIFRFVTGIGLGGALPNATALIYEFAPRVWRLVTMSVALVGVPLGGMFGAALARWMIPEFGWQVFFIVGGVIPGLLALLMRGALPESPRYLSGRPARYSELAALLNRIAGAPRYLADSTFVGGGAAQSGKSAISAIFAPEHRRETLTLWLIFFTNVFAIYFFFNWLPTVLSFAKLDFRLAVTGSLNFNLGGVVGTIVSSVVMGRLGSRKVLIAVGLLAVASVIAIATNQAFTSENPSNQVSSLMWSMAAAGACVNALQIGMYSVAAHAYPTFCRSTGVGWSLGVARFGGVVSSFAGSAFFTFGMMPRDFFFFIAGVLAITSIGVIVLRRHIPPLGKDVRSDHRLPR